ncbi:histidine phosphatase family protein [Cellulomonas shaoxiangyii]|uniref:Histidine phosphatase family protein n=1 Tax=Cellulomonas shaoxiangyii TaxID=2566013 RepID=A0A4P7SR65_9CELL|nr:histidine phosphatase family protein [Cellulomonas shaoxiangyii]TGY81426.1 histidine phosphatase family protein [Cellulomonas shaoxiangyii]
MPGAGRLLLWRHGRTAYNATARLQGQVDIPLDDAGRWQARTAASRIASRYAPTLVVSSDLSRAAETADALGRVLDLVVERDPRLRERGFGEWEGLTGHEIEARWPDEFTVWRTGGDPAGVGAESRADVAARVGAAVREYAARVGREGTVVVVSHGAAIGSVVADLLGQPPHWRGVVGMLNAHWAELTPDRGGNEPAWRLHGYNLGPTDASSDWNAGPDVAAPDESADADTRDPD